MSPPWGPEIPPREWIRHVWLDFQQMEAFEKAPLVVVEGRGLRVRTDDGREFIDAISAAMVSNLGYGDERIRAAMREAVSRQDFWPVLHSTTPAALRLARRLAELLPGDLDTTFFLTGGSEATETAMKMARQYHRNRGAAGRFKVISRYWSYHGATLGALAASGVADRRKFEPLPSGFLHVMPPYCYRCPWGKSPDSCDVECAQAFDDVVRYEGRDTVSAVIADPVMAAAGVLVPPPAYYRRLREICDANGILLIFDEVLTGFGRLGDQLLERDLVARSRASGGYLGGRLRELAERHPEIGDVRGLGMLWGVEFVADRTTKAPFPPEQSFATAVREQAQDLGMLCRGSAHVLILAPALVASREELDEIVEIVDRAIAAVREARSG